jgi:DNA replication regulator DPB11
VVPTAPLSSEDSAKLSSRKAQPRENTTKHPLKASTKIKGPPQRTRILELAPSAEPTPVSSTELPTVHHPRTRLSFLHQSDDDEDDDDDDNEPANGGIDAAASLPLQDINPCVNSPRRPSTSSNTSSKPNTKNDALRKPTPAPNTTPDLMTAHELVIPYDDSPINPPEDSVIPTDPPMITLADVPLLTNEQAPPVPREPIPEEKDHASIMASIMAARKAHAIAKVNDTTDEDPKKRRRRQLGRATSTRSNGSTADDLASRSSSAKHTIIDEGSVRDGEEIIKRKVYEEYQPSQELGWDAPGAQEQREQMIRAMGGVVEMGGMRVESIGLVKDVVSESVGGRGRKRRG